MHALCRAEGRGAVLGVRQRASLESGTSSGALLKTYDAVAIPGRSTVHERRSVAQSHRPGDHLAGLWPQDPEWQERQASTLPIADAVVAGLAPDANL